MTSIKHIRRSKIDSFIKFKELGNMRKDILNIHPEMKYDIDWSMDYLEKLLPVRLSISINSDYTSEEFDNTKNYVNSLLSEKYEDLVDYIIDENN